MSRSGERNEVGWPRVSIVVLNWNCRDDTIECLHSLTGLTYPDYETIVVDNGSTDGSPEAIREAFPEVELLTNPDNLGFAGGNNVGIRQALSGEAAYVFVLNNDTVVDPALLDELVATAEADSRIGVVGPKIYYYDQRDRLWYAGAREQWLRRIPATVGLDELDRGQHDQLRETAFVYGTAMLIRRQVLEQIGLLDEEFFAYHEDADFCIRARQAGYRCIYNPRGMIWHKVSASTRATSHVQDYLRAQHRILFFVKHLRGIRLLLVLFYELYRLAKVWIWRLRDGQLENAWAYTRGLWDGTCDFVLRPRENRSESRG
jgi:GT2 family glycosyltransferase